jgi:hypothetical protein
MINTESRLSLLVLAGAALLSCSWAKIPPTLGVSRYTCKRRFDSWRADGAWAAGRPLLAGSEHIHQLAVSASSV